MTNDEIAEMIAERNGNQHYCKNCDDCCQPYDSTDDCFKSALQAMELKDKQFQKVLDYAEICYGVFSFEQRENFINHIKEIFYGKE